MNRKELAFFLTSTLDNYRWKNTKLLLEYCRQAGLEHIPGLEQQEGTNYISVVQSIILFYYPGKHDIVHCVLKIILRYIFTKFSDIPYEIIDSILSFLRTSQIKDLKKAFPLDFLFPIIDRHVKHRMTPALLRLYKRYRHFRPQYINNVYRLMALLYIQIQRQDIDIDLVGIGQQMGLESRFTITKEQFERKAGRFDEYYTFRDHKTNQSFSIDASEPDSKIQILKIILDILLQSKESDPIIISNFCVGTLHNCLVDLNYLFEAMESEEEDRQEFENAIQLVESWKSTSEFTRRRSKRKRQD
jgi:hypothetical protein